MINRRTLLFGGLAAVFAPKESPAKMSPEQFLAAFRLLSAAEVREIVSRGLLRQEMNKFENATRRFLALKGIYPNQQLRGRKEVIMNG